MTCTWDVLDTKHQVHQHQVHNKYIWKRYWTDREKPLGVIVKGLGVEPQINAPAVPDRP
jgi:hypothetical protein